MNPEVVVITGASAGVGRATVREFARRGASLGLIARDRKRLEETAAEVTALGGKASVCICDVGDPKQVEQALQKIEDDLGPVDLWINNAMVSVFSPVRDMTPEEFEQVTRVTYLGAVYGTLAALKPMLARGRGTIVQIGSALAYRSIPLQAAYCAAKHALVGFTESLRTELLHDKTDVRVVMVHLPAVNTPQFGWVKSRLANKAQPVPPIFQPEVVAKGIYWAAHQKRREVYIGGPTLKAIWANKIAPSLADHYLARYGYESQQTDAPEDPNRPNNLWKPVPGEWAAHGSFDDRARDFSLQLWATRNRGVLAMTLLLVAGIALWPGSRSKLGG